MKHNPVQFAVVREDPALERALLDEAVEEGAAAALLIASGGCTALTLACERPDVALTLVDFNPAQLALVERKRAAVARGDRRALNVGWDGREGLNACGNFEGLFGGLRALLTEFAIDAEALERAFSERDALAPTVEALLAHPYWPVAFDLFLHDSLLHAMFGPAATQHAPRGSYPGYFRRVFERGLRREDAFDNYFLHHVLLGRYVDRPEALPGYLRAAPAALPAPETVLGSLADVPELSRFDLISLSNITDWMSRAEMEALGRALAPAKDGALALFRQLNNQTPLGEVLGPGWEPLPALGARLHAGDRSLFYERALVYRRRR